MPPLNRQFRTMNSARMIFLMQKRSRYERAMSQVATIISAHDQNRIREAYASAQRMFYSDPHKYPTVHPVDPREWEAFYALVDARMDDKIKTLEQAMLHQFSVWAGSLFMMDVELRDCDTKLRARILRGGLEITRAARRAEEAAAAGNELPQSSGAAATLANLNPSILDFLVSDNDSSDEENPDIDIGLLEHIGETFQYRTKKNRLRTCTIQGVKSDLRTGEIFHVTYDDEDEVEFGISRSTLEDLWERRVQQ